MKFKIEEGNLYLERYFDRSIDALKDLGDAGYSCLIVSRTPQEKLKAKLNFGLEHSIDFWWITDKGEGISSLRELEAKVENLPKKKAVLIDRLDHFIARDGFKETINFARNLSDIAYLKDLIFILVLDPSTLDEKSMNLLQKEANEIESRDIEKITEDLLSILKFVYSQNRLGIKPCYNDICKKLDLSKPTVRKKVKHLMNKDYLTESFKGTHKRVEITEKTRNLFST